MDEILEEGHIEEVSAIFERIIADLGYSQKTRIEVLRSAFVKHLRQVEEWKVCGQSLY